MAWVEGAYCPLSSRVFTFNKARSLLGLSLLTNNFVNYLKVTWYVDKANIHSEVNNLHNLKSRYPGNIIISYYNVMSNSIRIKIQDIDFLLNGKVDFLTIVATKLHSFFPWFSVLLYRVQETLKSSFGIFSLFPIESWKKRKNCKRYLNKTLEANRIKKYLLELF